MDELSTLKEFLEYSIKKNGDKPLTLQHLVNIIKKLEKQEEKNDFYSEHNYFDHDIY